MQVRHVNLKIETNKILDLQAMFSVAARELLAQQMNYLLQGDRPRSEAHSGHFSSDDMLQIAGTFLLATVTKGTTWRDFVRDPTRKGVKQTQLELLFPRNIDHPL